MRKRRYDGGTIKIVEKAYSTSVFNTYIIEYVSDGLKLRALMSIPKTKKPEKGFPVLVFNHGYIDPQTYSTINSYKGSFDNYASQGFIVIKPDYRAHDKSEGDPKQVLNRLSYAFDVLNLIAAIPTIPEADTDKIVLWGHSLGGDVALRVLEVSDKIKGATLWAPVVADYPESMLYFIRKNRPQELEKTEKLIRALLPQTEYDKLSPSKNTQFIKAPIIIHHGTADESVPYNWEKEFIKRLEANKIRHEFYTYPGENHNFTKGARGQILQRDLVFLKNLVK
jgi:dipeptidyl aminopeptidase/acylaminoacyl peptidase